jgi:hypothetical protein
VRDPVRMRVRVRMRVVAIAAARCGRARVGEPAACELNR